MKSLKIFAAVVFCALTLASGAYGEEVTIMRDQLGVPHIYADTDAALFFGQGYAMAQDRLFQMEMIRLVASGKLSKVMGEKCLPLDKLQRRDLYSDTDIQKISLNLPAEQKKIFQAFASGVNAYIKEALEAPDKKLPLEFRKFGLKPLDWKAEDVIKIIITEFSMYYECDQELKNAALYKHLIDKFGDVEGKNIFDDVIWKDDPGTPVTAPGWAAPRKASGGERIYSPSVGALAARYEKEMKAAQELKAALGVPTRPGSYAVAISGRRTQTGNPMLLAGPKIGFGIPSYYYECGLHGKEIDISGVSHIGFPGMLIGQNRDICWTITSGLDNQIDFFREKLNPKNMNQYWYKGKWVDMTKETYLIEVKDAKDVAYDVMKTVHGPVVGYDDKDPLNPVAYARAVSVKAEDIIDTWNTGQALRKARNSDEFFNAVRTSVLAINYISIDRKGDLSFMHSGKYPLRPENVDRRLPADGTGNSDWQGFMDPSMLPQAKNPSSGYFMTRNSKPAPLWDNGERTMLWGVQNKANVVESLMASPDYREVSFLDLKELDKAISITSFTALDFKPILLAALESNTEPGIREALTQLRYWNNRFEDIDGDGCYDSPGLLIFKTWWDTLVKDIFHDELGDYYIFASNDFGAPLVYRVLKGGSSPGMTLHHDYLNGKDAATVMTESLKKALEEIRGKYGKEPSKWLYKVVMEGLEPKLRVKVDLPMSQCDAIQMPASYRGSAVILFESSKNWQKAVSIVPPGNSGFVSCDGCACEHCRNQLEMFLKRKYKDLWFYPEDVQHHTESVKVLEFK
ncbi:MAG: penicillin acylase family protein [Candidatus Eremiobacteraeota bacterium]|nr:penicillin acylase family protein [Candidatus Eremiobacteraeota bacterium]